MKKSFPSLLFSFLISLPFFSLAQSTSSSDNRWNLSNYLYSHTHTPANTKPLLDFDAIDNWYSLGPNGNLSVSPDGKYIAYTVEKGIRYYKKNDSLIIQSTENSWRQSYAAARPGVFSADSKQYIFQDKEVLCFLGLGEENLRRVNGVSSYKLSTNKKNEWFAYQLKNNEKTVALQNLLTGLEQRFNNVSTYSFDKSGTWLALQLNNDTKELLVYNLLTGKEKRIQSVENYLFDASGQSLVLKIKFIANIVKQTTSLQYLNFSNDSINTIWSTTDTTVSLNNYNLDGSGKQVVFTLKDMLGENSIWYYKTGMDKAMLKVNNKTTGIDAGLVIQGAASFTNNDRYIQFSLQPCPDSLKPLSDAVKLDVWDYKDSILQSTQPYLLKEPVTYKAIINPKIEKVVYVERRYEKLYLQNGDFAIIKKAGRIINGDRFWEKNYERDTNWIMSLKDGLCHLLPTSAREWAYAFWFSPGGKYLVYFDAEQGCNYFSYELNTGKLVNISPSVAALGYENPYLLPVQPPKTPVGIAGWIEGDKGVLVYDNYDIWQLDMSGKKPPVNITNGYGRSHNLLFSLMESDRNRPGNSLVLHYNDNFLLRVFNRHTKYSGFYRDYLDSASNPQFLYMNPTFFEKLTGLNGLDEGMHPLKAADANTWIVKRQTVIESPNYFMTNDFKTYQPLTNLQANTGYNWVTTELISFKQLDGTISQGVLYKPENFDPAKKYPVIISFYGALSDRLYQYPTPGYIDAADIFDDPAWMVSHGYLVFTPDIYFTQRQWGPSTVNTIDGVAKYLSQLPYVNGKYIGAVGHSNSGTFSYYLLTHSHSFAAMSIGAGGTDVISGGLSLRRGSIDESALEIAEVSQYGSGGLGNLWQNKASWLDHTAVLHADQVSSPVLMFHNKADGSRVESAIEMFTALRRLEKKAWWLQYDDGSHRLGKLNDKRDFTIRYTQFFDHYLKEAPAPRWMTQGIPYKLKGIESRYELDPSGSCALQGNNPCPICKAWNQQYKRTPAMFTTPIAEWKLDPDIQTTMQKEEEQKMKENMKGEAERVKENNAKLKTKVVVEK